MDKIKGKCYSLIYFGRTKSIIFIEVFYIYNISYRTSVSFLAEKNVKLQDDNAKCKIKVLSVNSIFLASLFFFFLSESA